MGESLEELPWRATHTSASIDACCASRRFENPGHFLKVNGLVLLHPCVLQSLDNDGLEAPVGHRQGLANSVNQLHRAPIKSANVTQRRTA